MKSDGQGQIDVDNMQARQRGPFRLWSHCLAGTQAGVPEADWVSPADAQLPVS